MQESTTEVGVSYDVRIMSEQNSHSPVLFVFALLCAFVALVTLVAVWRKIKPVRRAIAALIRKASR